MSEQHFATKHNSQIQYITQYFGQCEKATRLWYNIVLATVLLSSLSVASHSITIPELLSCAENNLFTFIAGLVFFIDFFFRSCILPSRVDSDLICSLLASVTVFAAGAVLFTATYRTLFLLDLNSLYICALFFCVTIIFRIIHRVLNYSQHNDPQYGTVDSGESNLKPETYSEEDKTISAYHEVGHALIAALIYPCAPIQFLSLVPIGSSFGRTVLDDNPKFLTKENLEALIAICVAGQAAEEIAFGTTYASTAEDIKKATSLAKDYVVRYGMSKEFGPISMDADELLWSEKTKEMADQLVRDLLKQQYAVAQQLLSQNRMLLDELAAELKEKETISGTDFLQLLSAKQLQHRKQALPK